jgi:hypothetical protein
MQSNTFRFHYFSSSRYEGEKKKDGVKKTVEAEEISQSIPCWNKRKYTDIFDGEKIHGPRWGQCALLLLLFLSLCVFIHSGNIYYFSLLLYIDEYIKRRHGRDFSPLEFDPAKSERVLSV